MAAIRRLPESVVEQLRAGLVIGSLHQCVIELVHNALDAHATVVRVLVDVPAASVQVSDNGDGIDPANLELIGQRYGIQKGADFCSFILRTGKNVGVSDAPRLNSDFKSRQRSHWCIAGLSR
ncbi:DNA mismatch repair protein [Geranomyces michiganensis]|nr:DNA mismatch repair protein [Geranomyces michiganensis]